MSSWAERAYEYRTNGKRKQEDAEDIANKLIQRRNRLFERIGKISNHKELIEVNNELKALKADGYTDSNDLIMLRKQMKEQVQELKQTLTTKREEIAKKQDSLKKERYSESIDTLTQVNAEADKILLELLLQLSKDNVKNKVFLSDMMKRQDRATSIAIIKLSQMPVYEGLITPRMKENLLVLSKSDAEIKWQEKQDSRAVEVGKELADVTMKRFMLDKAETVIFPKENVMFD
jgi:isoleucyl-tRNA synthetase